MYKQEVRVNNSLLCTKEHTTLSKHNQFSLNMLYAGSYPSIFWGIQAENYSVNSIQLYTTHRPNKITTVRTYKYTQAYEQGYLVFAAG